MKLFIKSKTSIVQPLKFGNGYVISTPLYRVCNDLSMQRLKLIHVSKSGPEDQKRTVTDIMHMIYFVKKHQTNKRKIRVKWYEKDKKNERHLLYSVSLKRASSFRNNSDIWISDYWVEDQPNIILSTHNAIYIMSIRRPIMVSMSHCYYSHQIRIGHFTLRHTIFFIQNLKRRFRWLVPNKQNKISYITYISVSILWQCRDKFMFLNCSILPVFKKWY